MIERGYEMAVTEEQRKSNSKAMMIYMGVIAGIASAYFLGYVCSIMEDAGCGFIDALRITVTELGELHFMPPISTWTFAGVLGGALIGIVVYFLISVDYERNYSYKLDEVAGSGGFMTQKEFKKYKKEYIKQEPADPTQPSPNIILGHTFRRPNDARMLRGTNNNVMIVGGAGAGKSRGLMKPGLLGLNNSFVVTDPSGEMLKACGKVLADNGYKIKIFNISDMEHSNMYNPIAYVRDQAGVGMVIDCLINNTTAKNTTEEGFWPKSEKILYTACIFYLLEFCNDESKKNWATITNMINMSMVDENNAFAKSPLDKLFDQCPPDSLAWSFYNSFKHAAGKTMKSVIISCLARLQAFMTPQVANLTKTDELELEKLGDEKTALFIVVPQADHTYDFLTAMLYSQLFETLYFKCEQRQAAGGSVMLDIPVRCMMDEFANQGVIPEFPSKLSTMRKYNISATVVLQDLSQLEAMYKDDWRTVIGNCSTIVFLGGQEQNTTKYFSEQLGKMTVTNRSRGYSQGGRGGNANRNFQQTAREVMTPDELARMPSDEEIVFSQGRRPYLDKKYQYETHPLYSKTGDADPRNAFLYKEILAYNNSKKGVNLDNLLKAQSEIAKYMEREAVTDSENTDDLRLQGSKEEAYNALQLAKKEAAQGRMHAIQSCLEQILETYSDPVSVTMLAGIQSKSLPDILGQAALQSGKDKVILLSDLGSDIMVGCSHGVPQEELEKDGYLVSVEPYEDYLLFIIRSRAYEVFREIISGGVH